LLAAATTSSAAEFLTVEVRTRVTHLYDPSGVLGGQVAEGQVVMGTYKYDIQVPDQAVDPYFGAYVQPYASLKLVAGMLVFESEEVSGMQVARHVAVEPSRSPGNSAAMLRIESATNKQLPNGASVAGIGFEFRDSTGQEPASDALPSTAPNLHNFSERRAFVHGELAGQHYSIGMDIEHVYSTGTESDFVISPGKSTFVYGQRFDVALLVPPQSQVVRAHSSLNGMRLPMSYPGSCHLASPNSQNRPTIVCPDAHLQLPAMEGTQRVDWAVELLNGDVIENSVEWTMIP
jgi:hypothetical protein